MDHCGEMKGEVPFDGKWGERLFRETPGEFNLPLAADIVKDGGISPAYPAD